MSLSDVRARRLGDPGETAPSGETVLAKTQASKAYELLRRDIVAAKLRPGQKLRINELCHLHGIGLSPMREALNRLCAERLLCQSDQRGFFVAPLSAHEFAEVVRTRCWLDEIGLRESIVHGDAAWEESVLIACHRLSRIDRHTADDSGQVSLQWDLAHRHFHTSLVSACRSSWLIEFSGQLFDAASRYRNVARLASRAKNWTRPGHLEEHNAIAQAAVARRADSAAELLKEHFRTTARLINQNHCDAAPDL